jgi:hypothetical protein
MKPFDVSNYKVEEAEEKWTLNENFASWSDSNTPEIWQQMEGAEKSAISFVNAGSVRVAALSATADSAAGIYTRYNASRAFTILARARYTGGEAYSLVTYSLGGGEVFCLSLKNEMIDVCERSIPLHTADWHDYRLTSEDGKMAALSVDGELISGRIPPVKRGGFAIRGIYALYSALGESSKGEVQYIKAR